MTTIKVKRKHDNIPIQQGECVICQGRKFIWGQPRVSHLVRFRPYNNPHRYSRRQFGYALHMRVCKACGHAQVFIRYKEDLSLFR